VVSLGPIVLEAAFLQVVHRAETYEERLVGPVVRQELPSAGLVVIFDVDHALVVEGQQLGPAFVAGPGLRPTRTEHAGRQRGVELRLAPWAVRELFGIDAHELHGRIVPLSELSDVALGRGAPPTAERLSAWLAPTIRAAPDVARSVVRHGYRRLLQSGGRLRIAELVAELGYSHTHLVDLFRRHVGSSPKQVARLARLEAFLSLPATVELAEVARHLGFSDQAHLSREIKALTGQAPSVLRGDR